MAALLEVEQIDLFRGETQVLWGGVARARAGRARGRPGQQRRRQIVFAAAVTAAIPPAAGAIRFDGRPLAGKRPHDVTGLGIALVPEGRRVYKDMSVRRISRWALSPSAPAAG